LAGSLDWIDFSALRVIDEEFRVLLSASPYIDELRTDALCQGLEGRVRQFERLALKQRYHESMGSSQDKPGLSRNRRTLE